LTGVTPASPAPRGAATTPAAAAVRTGASGASVGPSPGSGFSYTTGASPGQARDDISGVNPLWAGTQAAAARDLPDASDEERWYRRRVAELTALLDQTMGALNDLNAEKEAAEARAAALEARLPAAASEPHDATAARLAALERELAELRRSQAAADLCLLQLDGQARYAHAEAAALRAQLADAHARLVAAGAAQDHAQDHGQAAAQPPREIAFAELAARGPAAPTEPPPPTPTPTAPPDDSPAANGDTSSLPAPPNQNVV